MSPQWGHMAYSKIHENCGGLVHWVEAVDQPGVGFTGECLACHDDGIPKEYIIPIRTDTGQSGMELVDNIDRETLADLEWHDNAKFTENQQRLREEIGKP